MLWMVVLVVAAILTVQLVPLLGNREPWDLNETPDRLRHLKWSRDRVMRTLKDLESDFREGTLAEEDYQDLRLGYKTRAIRLTKELKRVRETLIRQIADEPGRPLSRKERDRLEKLIGQRKKKYASTK